MQYYSTLNRTICICCDVKHIEREEHENATLYGDALYVILQSMQRLKSYTHTCFAHQGLAINENYAQQGASSHYTCALKHSVNSVILHALCCKFASMSKLPFFKSTDTEPPSDSNRAKVASATDSSNEFLIVTLPFRHYGLYNPSQGRHRHFQEA